MKPIVLSLLVVVFVTNASQADSDLSVVATGAKVTRLADGMKFTEGPVWLPAENMLVFSDIPNSKLMQWSEAAGLSVYRASR